ncbi:BRISC and BRCA1-A complex member 2-like [Tachysurus ichikawai]
MMFSPLPPSDRVLAFTLQIQLADALKRTNRVKQHVGPKTLLFPAFSCVGSGKRWAARLDTALDPGEDVALLSVSFEDAEATQVFPKLFLSPSIEQFFLLAVLHCGSFNNVLLPLRSYINGPCSAKREKGMGKEGGERSRIAVGTVGFNSQLMCGLCSPSQDELSLFLCLKKQKISAHLKNSMLQLRAALKADAEHIARS